MTNRALDRRAHPPGAVFTEWQAGDGWTLRRMDWRQPKDAEARGSLLFAGGRGDFIEKYFEAKAWWHRRGWNVTSFDWRGQGASQCGLAGGHLDSLDPLVDDLDALIANWREETPGPHVAVAHSMGGHVLLRTLAEQRPKLDAAVLVAPMLSINSGPLPGWSAAWIAAAMTASGLGRRPAWQQSGKPPPPGSWRQTYLTACPERYADELYWWEREPGFNLGPPSWAWLDAAYRSCALLTRERLERVKTPLLFVATERDRLVSAAAIRRAAGMIPGAELLMFEEAAHEILREEDPVRLEALGRIDEFFDRHAAR